MPDTARLTTPTRDSDPDGNDRLTSANGMLLLVLLAAEGVTILSVGQLITAHIVIGVALAGPLALKCASTIHRFWRYYTGDAGYTAKGPPPVLLRLLGPVVLATSVAVVGTGIGLIYVRPGDSPWLFLHKASFVLWFAAMTVHVVGHIVHAARTTAGELRAMPRPAARRRSLRLGLVALSLLVGVGAAAALLPSATHWTQRSSFDKGGFSTDH